MDASVYDADYYLRGEETKKSLYTDYRWLPDGTIPMEDNSGWLLMENSGDILLE